MYLHWGKISLSYKELVPTSETVQGRLRLFEVAVLNSTSEVVEMFQNWYHFSHCSKSSFLVQKFNFYFPRKIVELFWVKIRENAAVWDFLAVDNFDFTRKIVKKKLSEKLVKMLGICTF